MYLGYPADPTLDFVIEVSIWIYAAEVGVKLIAHWKAFRTFRRCQKQL